MSPSTIIIIVAFSLAILAAIGLGQLERFGNWRRDQARIREIEIHKKLWGNRLDRRMLGDYGPLTDGISKYENDGLVGDTLTDVSAMATVESLSDEQLFGTPFAWDIVVVHSRQELYRMDGTIHPKVQLEDGTLLSGLWTLEKMSPMGMSPANVLLPYLRSVNAFWTMPASEVGRR